MRRADVFFNNRKAGVVSEYSSNKFGFIYDSLYLADEKSLAISYSFPKQTDEFVSDKIFPFFANMLPEGKNLELFCRVNQVDADDLFGVLLATSNADNIGAVSVRSVQ